MAAEFGGGAVTEGRAPFFFFFFADAFPIPRLQFPSMDGGIRVTGGRLLLSRSVFGTQSRSIGRRTAE